MLVLAGEIHHLGDLSLGDLVSEDATLANPVVVNVEHDLGRRFHVLIEEFLEHVNDELHWSVIVVQNQDTVEIGPLGLWLDLGDNRGGGTTEASGAVLVIAHSDSNSGRGRRQMRIGAQSWLRHGTSVQGPHGSPD